MDLLSMRDVVGILMESAFYFDLDLKERPSLIKHIFEMSSCEQGTRRKCIHWI